jgi:hypothetical protein
LNAESNFSCNRLINVEADVEADAEAAMDEPFIAHGLNAIQIKKD